VYWSRRIVSPVIIPILAVAAIFGYLLGKHGEAPPSGGESAALRAHGTQLASADTVLFEYPTSWRRVATAPAVPELAIAHPFLLAPGGEAKNAGLVSGQFGAGEPGPLPRRFLALARGTPHTEVVSLTNTQAYRYSRLDVPGLKHVVDLYVIPRPGAGATVIGCYASSGYLAYLHQCEEIVAQLTLVGQSTPVLSPATAYAAGLGRLLVKLEGERVRLRGEIHARSGLAGAGTLAGALAQRFADASRSLRTLEAPAAADAAQSALARALEQAQAAYAALALAGAQESPEEYALAKSSVEAAEREVDATLETFALLGYASS
jgi:hypothetical protein